MIETKPSFSYSFRPSALAPERQYALDADQLTWTGDNRGSLAYNSVAKVKVYQARFWGSSKSYWTCVLYPHFGKTIYLSAAHRAGGRTIEDRTATYIPFIKELETRIAAAGQARFVKGRGLLSLAENGAGWIAVKMLRALGRIDCDRSANALAKIMCTVGPRLRGNRLARAQLAVSFPEKTPEEIEKILGGVWDNMGRVVAEYSHLGELWDFDEANPKAGRILIDPIVVERLHRLRADTSRPALMFASHQANWELLGLAATAYERDIILVYREPKIAPIADEIVRLRGSGVAGLIPAGRDAPLKVRKALQENRLVGMLVDQYDARGSEVTFFGRRCRVNNMLGRMARLFECPVYGARVVRLPDRRYHFEMTDPLTPPRDSENKIDADATMQMATTLIEGWAREHPEQWMWTHRRWR